LIPYFQFSIPTACSKECILGNRGISDAGYPVSVIVLIIAELAISQSVPELETSVSTS